MYADVNVPVDELCILANDNGLGFDLASRASELFKLIVLGDAWAAGI